MHVNGDWDFLEKELKKFIHDLLNASLSTKRLFFNPTRKTAPIPTIMHD